MYRLGFFSFNIVGFSSPLLPVIVMTFWYVYRNGLNFFELFKLLFSFGIGHDPHVLYDLCLFLFLMFHYSHDYMAKRSHYRIMIFSTLEYY